MWTADTYIAAAQLDALNGANWQRGSGKGRKPKPTTRPDPQRQERRRQYVRRLQNLGLIDGR